MFLTSPDITADALASIEGMHAYAKDKGKDIDMETFMIKKVTIGYELSAAQHENGEETLEDEIHYYYYYLNRENKMVGDLYFEPNTITQKEMDRIAESIIYTS